MTVEANPPTSANEFNHALGGTASASGYKSGYEPGKAIDGYISTYWKSSSTTGWLAVVFARVALIDEVHIHFNSVAYKYFDLYLDTNSDGIWERAKSETANTKLDYVWAFSGTYTEGVKIVITKKQGSNYPQIKEMEAYLRGDSDGDGLTNDQEAKTIYYQEVPAQGLPIAIVDDGTNVSTATTTINQWSGVFSGAFAGFTLGHPTRSELTVSVGYWNGTA